MAYEKTPVLGLIAAILMLALTVAHVSGCAADPGPARSRHPAKGFDMTEIRVARIVEMTPLAQTAGGTLATDNLGPLTVTDARNWQICLKYQARNQPLGIEYDGRTREVAFAWPAETDAVAAIGAMPSTGDRVMVQLMMRPTLLYLDKKSARFEALYSLLAQAAREKSKVAVGVFPGGDTISDARILP